MENPATQRATPANTVQSMAAGSFEVMAARAAEAVRTTQRPCRVQVRRKLGRWRFIASKRASPPVCRTRAKRKLPRRTAHARTSAASTSDRGSQSPATTTAKTNSVI